VLAALNGLDKAIALVLGQYGADPCAHCENLFAHASPVHHAVTSGSLEAVRVLVDAGANLDAKDTAHQATPVGWAEYSLSLQKDAQKQKQFEAILAYLKAKTA